ncbi:hypothetical protein C7S18_13995 [Ahniella affigens]|uniref:Uncharacterized protein n=1 Tax=Ahniella affigens TaxID=2021234 RepID=A0A2P1PTR5_9GAMM|nr:hypothetical protein C7S18_13995 [Ahniella affigens]
MNSQLPVYGISDDRLRQRVEKRALRIGLRVQESEFEVCTRTPADFDQIIRELTRLLKDAGPETQIRWYGLNDDGCARSGVIGSLPPFRPPTVRVL